MSNFKIDPLIMSNLKIDPSTYVLKFGKYKNMLAVDVVDFQTVNKKGQCEDTGLKYLQWLTTCSWFENTDFIKMLSKYYCKF